MILELQHRRPDGDVDTYHLKPGRRYHLGRGSNCEVRILDLKLSRKHAAIEFIDEQWQLIDLCSTNGCHLDGHPVIGTKPLQPGAEIEMGQTVLTISRIDQVSAPISSLAPSDEFKPQDADPQPKRALADRFGKTAEFPPAQSPVESSQNFKPTTLPPVDDAVAITPVNGHPVLTPPAPVAPAARVIASGPVRPVVIRTQAVDDLEATVATAPPAFVMPSAPTPLARAPEIAPIAQRTAAPVATPLPVAGIGEERSYFITVLGKRIGPLSRAIARDLKARELKGTLCPADIESYPTA